MADELPDYLKGLDSVLGTGTANATGTATTATTATTALATFSTTPAPFSLSTIGFGSMFKKEEDKRPAFLLVSTHAHQVTGYSKVSYGIIGELVKEPSIRVVHFGFQKFTDVPPTFRPYPAGVEVIDAAALEKPTQQGFNFGLLPDVIRRVKPRVVMIYNDLAIVSQYVEAIRKSGIPRNFQIWVYCDQVYTMQNQQYIDLLNRDADRVFAFTSFWKKCLKDQGVTRPIDVLHHGFESKHVFQVPKDLARKQVQLPQDMFLFLNLNRNQPRKRYDILIMAFVELITKYPTKPLFLLCICDKGDRGGWWLFELFARELKLRGVSVEAFGSRLMVSSMNMNLPDELINMYYNAADVGITTADGEGWGLCQFEQMGVGVPQVVPDVGGFKEYCTADNSQIVPAKIRSYVPTAFCPVGGEAHACAPDDVCRAMEDYVLNSELIKRHGEAARATVAAYTWEKACGTLLRRIKALDEEDD